MGTTLSLSLDKHANPDAFPVATHPPTFDPHTGFPKKRKEREMKVSLDQMRNAGLEVWQMDYCAHKLIDWKECGRNYRPFASWWCQHENHAYQECEFHEAIHQLKEFERERRLLKRMKRKREAAEAKLAYES